MRKGERTTKITTGKKEKVVPSDPHHWEGKIESGMRVCLWGGPQLMYMHFVQYFLFFFLLLCFCLNNFSLVRHDIRERREGVLFFGSLFLPSDFFPARFDCA